MKDKKLIPVIFIDLALLFIAVMLALSLQWKFHPTLFSKQVAIFCLLSVVAMPTSFYFFGIYQRLWRYAVGKDFINIILAVTGGTFFILIASLILLPPSFLRAIPSLWLISLLFYISLRSLQRMLREYSIKEARGKKRKKALIIGAGGAGAMIARTLFSSKTTVELEPIGFIDDDPIKFGSLLYGLPILGNRDDIPQIIQDYSVDEAIIAIPSATPKQINFLAEICLKAKVATKILPSVLDIIEGKILLEQMQELQVSDLLHRSEIEMNLNQVSDYLKDQVVLVTGAGGSIGSELCRQICAFQPKKLILIGRGENSIHEISLELSRIWPEVSYVPLIADIRDQEKILEVFTQYRPMVIFHAAAHKHVSLMEAHPDEAFKNNVFGTLNVARTAHLFKAKIFVAISTDKAVNPKSIMGLTKLLAEMIIRSYADISTTKFVAVRFGNVLGSRGSVVQLFRKQIAYGGPITITHPDMKRYFMSISEAAQLVLEAGALAQGGELFMLDMGEQIKIVDLAKDMIRLSGLCPDKDIEIKYIGNRPGEKLAEELFSGSERTIKTENHKIFLVVTSNIDNEIMELVNKVSGFPTTQQLADVMNLSMAKYNFRK